MRFERQTAVVTGAGQGIGRATADLLLEQGATVYYTDVDAALLGDVPKSDRAICHRLDVTREEEWRTFAAVLKQDVGHLDILINNAGVDMMCPIEDVSLENWRKLMQVNVEGTFLGVRELLALLEAAKDRRRGGASIVNFSSIMGQKGMPLVTAYCTSKGAIKLFTKSLAAELAPRGIRVNSIHPGMITGPMMENGAERARAAGSFASAADFIDYISTLAPMGRAGDPKEVAAGVAFLASEEASYVTGSELNVDGGYNAS